MLMPSILRENLLDDFFEYPLHGRRYGYSVNELMRTDVKDVGSGYELIMNLPGVKKEDVKAELKDGYLTINATSNSENNETDGNGKYVRRERYMGSCSRSFYVGEELSQEDIKARFEDGTLKLTIPKNEKASVVENKNYIAIEG